MQHVLDAINQILNMANDPYAKTIMLWVFGQAWKKWPNAQTRAIPMLTMIGSIILGTGQVVTAIAVAGGAKATAMAVAVAAGKSSVGWALWDSIVGTAIPVLVATGTHSWSKNLAQWIASGAQLFHESVAAPPANTGK